MLQKILKWIQLWIHWSLYLALPLALFAGNWVLVFLSFISILLIRVTKILFRKRPVYLPIEFEWAIGVFIYFTLFLGDGLGFYHKFYYWDWVFHFTSGVIIGLIGFLMIYALYKANEIRTSFWLLGIFSFSFAMAIGGLWEILEYTIDTLILHNTYMQNDLNNTMRDLINDSLGALVASIWGYFYMKDNKYNFKTLLSRFIKKHPIFIKKIKEKTKSYD